MFPMNLTYDDLEMVRQVLSMGIDSRLEGFTKSTFKYSGNDYYVTRLECQIHPDEIQILIRRLLEFEVYESDEFADDIVNSYYGAEIL